MRMCVFLITLAPLAPFAASGLAPEMGWQITGAGGYSAVNTLLDGTGNVEALIVCELNTGVVCLNLDGTPRWTYPLTPPVTAAPALADLTGDGRDEILAADATGVLVALSENGALVWEVRLPGGVTAASCPAAADLNGNGRSEILVGDESGALSCFDAKGTLLWRFRGDGTRMGPVLVAEVYDTPGPEIFVTSHDQHIYALTARGEWLWDIYREDDLFPNTNPIVADVDGDGIPELYIGGGLHHFYRVDLERAAIVLEENFHMHINGAIDAADLDGDGCDEVVFGNKAGAVWCYGKEGFRWMREFQKSSMLGGPVFLDVDDDPHLEILFHSGMGDFQVIKADGSLLCSKPIPCPSAVTPLAGDLSNNGMAELILTAPRVGQGGVRMAWVELGVPYRASLNNRLFFAGNRARSGRPPGVRTFDPIPTPSQSGAGTEIAASPYGDNMLFGGPNLWRYDVVNPVERRLLLLTEIQDPGGVVQRVARHIFSPKERATVPFVVEQRGRYRIVQRVIDADSRAVLSVAEASQVFKGISGDRAYLQETVFRAIESTLDSWSATNPACAQAMNEELSALRGRLADLFRDASDRRERMTALRKEAERLRDLATAGKALAPRGDFLIWRGNPWGYFDPVESLPTPGNVRDGLDVALCAGEYESLVLNLTNISGAAIDVRVRCGDVCGAVERAASRHIQLSKTVTVPTERRERVADALVPLDEAGLLSIPKFESAQVWITVNAVDLPPGQYVAELVLKSIAIDPTEISMPIHIVVHDLALPRPRPVRVCVWTTGTEGLMSTGNDAVLRDLVEHGVTVFFPAAPEARWDQNGTRLGPIDYSRHDDTVRRLAPHGFLLFLTPQSHVRGPEFLSEPWKRAFVAYVRDWAAHLKALGLDYDGWAFYPYDEPSSPFTETTLHLIEVAKLIREADPNILIYTDPTSGTTMETVRMFTGLIDIWQPSSELLERLGPELLPEAKRVGKEVWFYDAAGGAKTLSCLGIYRWRFWFAWRHGLTGVGWWVYAHHGGEDLWDGPNATGDFFATVYDGATGPISSKRWEAAREGVEDYEYLVMLRQRIHAAERRGVPDSALDSARQLLAGAPEEMEATLRRVGRRLPLTPDSVPLYDQATGTLEGVRRRIVEACLALDAL